LFFGVDFCFRVFVLFTLRIQWMPAASTRCAAVLSLALAGAPLGCAARQQETRSQGNCIVGRIADGDSFRCADGRRVRLTGIDSPESRQQPYGERARQALLELLPAGRAVRLESDVAPTDRYGRVLAYVWAGPILVNETMVRDGWAVLYTVPPNVKYAERLTRAQKEARARGAGLWSQHGFECLPNDFRRKRCVSPP
jgi:micrococcal nuclease